MPSPKGTAATLRASVGRNALIPPHPAAAQTPAGGINPAPTTDGRPAANPEKPRSRCTANLCRGRCLHCARRRVSEANRAAGPALRPEIVPGTPRWRKVSREGHGPPLQTTENDRPNRTAATTQATVGRDALIPPHPAAAQTPAGGINPAPTIDGRPVPTGEPHLLQPMGASAFMAFRFPPGRTPTRGRRHPPRSGAAARRTRRAAAAGGSAAS